MSWMSELVSTYDNSRERWGRVEPGSKPGTIPLLRIGQSTQNAQIEILLDPDAQIISAHLINDKAEQMTVIPCTEGSIGRSGAKIAPHPLHDKLQYVAGDYSAHGGDKVPGWGAYMEQIDQWCNSTYCHPRVEVVRKFVSRGLLIEEISNYFADSKKVKEFIAENAFVRFCVDIPGEYIDSRLWLDQSVTDSFLTWQKSLNTKRDLCYVSGEMEVLSGNHPSKLRHTGDKAKLISANDNSGFTYRGRFLDDKQAVGVSYEASQKAHNMLKWLIARHGYRNDSQVFVTWGTKLQKIPSPEADGYALFEDGGVEENDWGQNLRLEYATRVKRGMEGYSTNLDDSDGVVVLGLDSATTGRLSIIFYRELRGSEYLERIKEWHENCAWLHEYKTKDKNRIVFYGAPAPLDIALTAYGNHLSDKLKKTTVERLLRCIVDGKPIPPDIRKSLVRRASNPVAMEGWEWSKTLSIACAVVRKHMSETGKGEWGMNSDEENKDRSYLFGRLLAYAQHIESYSQFISGNSHRQTSAERMMQQFSRHPSKTWNQLYMKLLIYTRQISNPGLVNKWNIEIEKIMKALGRDNFSNKELDEQFLLGYHVQRMELRNQKNDKMEESEDDTQKQN
ncbi:MAG: type I-C CRISPR-associated protein Cas8c/Csd1 [Aminipila sp.]